MFINGPKGKGKGGGGSNRTSYFPGKALDFPRSHKSKDLL